MFIGSDKSVENFKAKKLRNLDLSMLTISMIKWIMIHFDNNRNGLYILMENFVRAPKKARPSELIKNNHYLGHYLRYTVQNNDARS